MNPMETAPRDGREVVLRIAGSENCAVARWHKGAGKGWLYGGFFWVDDQFTGWLPLPTEDQAKRIEELEKLVREQGDYCNKSVWRIADLERQLTELRASMEVK